MTLSTLLIYVFLSLVLFVGADIFLQYVLRSALSKRNANFEMALLFALAAFSLGSFILLYLHRIVAPYSQRELLLLLGGVCVFGSGAIGYIQCKSLFSRGYTIRVLVDLAERGGIGRIPEMKMSYGGGVGLSGMLVKRFQSMASLGMLEISAERVGPLTPKGRRMAWIGNIYRRLLRLDTVG